MSAIFNILVKVDPKQAKAGASEIQGVLGSLSDQASGLVGKLGALYGAMKLKEMVEGFFSISQQYTDIQNKLRVVTTGTASLNNASEQTLRIANETRTSWEATVTLFSRISQNAAELNVGQNQILAFTEQVQKAVIISGATAQEAHAALIQLSQGMASGALRGDELRSVMEQLPIVADVIAKKLGVTRGEMRAMGREGKITSKVIIDAFADASDELDKKFGRTIPTLSQQAQVFGDRMTEAIGKIDKSLMASRVLGDFIDKLGRGLGAVGEDLAESLKSPGAAALEDAENFVAEIERVKQLEENYKKADDAVTDMAKSVKALQDVGVKLDFNEKLARDFAKLSVAMNEYWGTKLPAQFDETTRRVVEVEKALDKLVEKKHGEQVAREAQLLAESLGLVNPALDEITKHWEKVEDRVRNIRTLLTKPLGGDNLVDKLNSLLRPGVASLFKGTFTVGQLDEEDSFQGGAGTFDPKLFESKTKDIAKLSGQDLTKLIDDYVTGLIQLNNRTQQWGDTLSSIKIETRKLALEESVLLELRRKGLITQEEFERRWKKHHKSGGIDPDIARLEALLKKSNDVIKAMEELREATEFINRPKIQRMLEARGLSGDKILTDLEFKLEPRIHPLEPAIGKIIDETESLRGTNDERAREAELRRIVNELTEKGWTVKDRERELLDDLLEKQQKRRREWEAEKAIVEQVTGPQRKYQESLAAIARLVEDTTISQQQANVVSLEEYALYVKSDEALSRLKGKLIDHLVVIEKIKASLIDKNITQEEANRLLREENEIYTKSNDEAYKAYQRKKDEEKHGKPGAETHDKIREGLKQYAEDIMDLSDDVLSFVKKTGDALDSLIMTAVETGKFEWERFGEVMLHTINEIALAILKAAAMRTILSFASSSPLGAFGTNPITDDVSDLGFGGGYARGGSYTVPGSGAPDSVYTLFKLTPGEQVDFTPPGSRPMAVEAGEYGILLGLIAALLDLGPAKEPPKEAPPPKKQQRTVIHNHWDTREIGSYVRSPSGTSDIVNVARRERDAFGSIIRRRN